MDEGLSGGPRAEGRWWYNVETRQVEDGPQSDWTQLIGPYATREEAEHAMDKVRSRNEAWDAEEEA